MRFACFNIAAALAAGLALSHVRVIDGDTVADGAMSYRIVGIDAPEIGRAKCKRERDLALASKARAAELVAGARRVEAEPTGSLANWEYDIFDRRLARIRIDGVDLSDALLAEGHARKWAYGKEKKPNWCAD